LESAVELAHEVGASNMSLDAVARRAQVSKGGLLYHFPTKNDLMRALVAYHMERSEQQLTELERQAPFEADSVIRACLDVFVCQHDRDKTTAAGFLAALAENPGLIEPVRSFNRRLLDRIDANASDPGRALVVFLALQGLRCMPLLDIDILTPAEEQSALAELRRLVGNKAEAVDESVAG
jgi:AcrR family transcriptional regulator